MALHLMREDDQFEVCDKDLPGIPDGDPEVFYTLRKLTPGKHRAILKGHTKPEFQKGVGRVDKTDGFAAMDDIVDHVIVSWRGVLIGGQPAPCTRELKLDGLDLDRKKALVDRAGMNEIAREPERRAESFQASA